eukprot:TRINITY_DN26334_c0_g1_i1.p1 TRINITY_DN26334_c0_g1~~TRINITY_DN26334_c0_g1_i1.p1  ORF type:complete len:755 (+),score=87.54 TRINITY_DN26334_c0_g1_i1:1397-3661(+)
MSTSLVLPTSGPRYAAVKSPRRHAAIGVTLLCTCGVLITFTLINISVRVFDCSPSARTSASILSMPTLTQEERKALKLMRSGGKKSPELTMTFFCAPKPYDGPEGPAQKRALLSWLRMQPTPKVVLLGQHPSFDEVAKSFPGIVSVQPDIDVNLHGFPLFHSMIGRSMVADTNISIFINADILLLRNVHDGLQMIASTFGAWVITGMRWDVKEFPFTFEVAEMSRKGSVATTARLQASRVLGKGGQQVGDAEMEEYAIREGSLHTYGGVDFWAWNNLPGVPLVKNPVPPFVFGAGRYDNWLTHEIVSAGLRDVIDGSDAMTTVHVLHEPEPTAAEEEKPGQGKLYWMQHKPSPWESFVNVYLSQNFGSNFTNQKGTAQHLPWKLMSCHHPLGPELCLLRRKRPGACQCEHSPFVGRSQTDPALVEGTRIWKCGMLSVDKVATIPTEPTAKPVPGLPHTLKELVNQVAEDNVVVLTGCSFASRDLLMNFVCNLRSLGVSRFLIAAFDEEMYRFAFIQGLPVFLQPAPSTSSVTADDCLAGSACHTAQSHLKTHAALAVLELGVSVVWSDVDVLWLSEPVEALTGGAKDTSKAFIIQSTEGDKALPANGVNKLSTSIYFAPATANVLRAFREISASEKLSNLPDQKAFYGLLCGPQGERRKDDNSCEPGDELVVTFLDRSAYPTGLANGVWDSPNVAEECRSRGCLALVNNAVSDTDLKIHRLQLKNSQEFWRYEQSTRMCLHAWHKAGFLEAASG